MREAGQEDTSTKLNGDAVSRRDQIRALDELARGQQAISLNFAEIDAVVADLAGLLDREREQDEGTYLPEAATLLGPPGNRGLPTAQIGGRR
jgi:hypothetical protein